MTRPPTVAVLMACHNRRARTLACLAGLAAQETSAHLHPIVFDDGSTDGTAGAISRTFPDAEILEGSGTAFWAGGMRQAFTQAMSRDFDFYLWLNDDVVLASDAIARLLQAHDRLKAEARTLCLIGGALHDPLRDRIWYGGIRVRSGWNPLLFDRVGSVSDDIVRCDTLNGNVVLVPRETAQAMGSIGAPFIQTLGDLDYGLRVTRAGGWVGLAPGILGHCASNEVEGRWLNPELSMRARWRVVGAPLGLPLRPWLHFARRHGGPFWFVFAPLIYWRLFVPPWLIRAGRRWLSGRTEVRRRHVSAS